MKSEKCPTRSDLVRLVRLVGFVGLIASPLAIAIAMRERSAQSDYAPEWWAVMAALSVSVGCIAAMTLLCRKAIGRTVALAAMLAVAAATAYEAVLGLCQIAGLSPSVHSMFRLTGTFYNPGPYGGYVAMGLPVGLSLYLGRSRWLKWVGFAVVMLALVVLPASASRSAWVAGATGCAFVTVFHRRDTAVAWLRRWWLPLTVGVLAAAVGAYMLKADSANGRLLMWRIGLRACAAHPWGVGWHGVAGAYGEAQEAYFASGAGTAGEIAVAGSPEYLFNEYLQIALAWGWPASLTFIAALVTAVIGAVRARLYGVGGALLTFAVFSISSYPLQFPLFTATVIMLIVSVAASCCKNRRQSAALSGLCLIIAAISGSTAVSQYDVVETYSRWQQTRYFYRSSNHHAAIKAMKAFGDSLAWNPNFMFELGHSLSLTGEYLESNRVLARAAKVCGDPMIYNLRGKNYQSLGDSDSAFIEFQRAAHRLPNRMYPHYLMVRLAAGVSPVDTPLLRREARIVLDMPVKIMSPAVREMRDSTQKLLDEILPAL